MDKNYYTPNGMHPEDEIARVSAFLTELTNVQTLYFKQLVADLGLNEKGDEWLFDYVFNYSEDGKLTFEEYLDKYKIKYKELVKKSKACGGPPVWPDGTLINEPWD